MIRGEEKISILIVDDEPANIKVLLPVLTEQGYEVRTALGGELALSSVVAKIPDLILLDVRMPGIDGFEVCRRLKADHRVSAVPIIFVSALGETSDVVEGLKLVGVDYITKPLRIEEVLARVATHLSIQALQMQLHHTNDQLRVEIDERIAAETALKNLNEELERRVKQRTARLHAQNIELMEAKEAAEAASIAKTKFLSNLSHELRTPLNPIMGYAQILKTQRNLTDDQKSQLQIICDSCVHLTTLISDMLELVRVDTHPGEVERVAFNPAELVRGIVRDTRKKAEKKNLTVRCEAIETLPEVVYGDGRMLQHVLLHLLDNAVKFTDVGGVRVRSNVVKSPQARGGRWHIRFEVIDSGMGIPHGIMGDIFHPFFQGEIEGRLIDGPGLGLTLSRRLVELMEGHLSVQSPCRQQREFQAGGPGSKFMLELYFDAVEDGVPPVRVSRKDSSKDHAKPKRVLIVDDNATNRNLLVHALQPQGLEMTTANDGREALEQVAQDPPDLILLDLLMPGVDGAEVLAQIRRDPELDRVKIIGVSAADGHGRLSDFAKTCDDFLEKPVNIRELREKIKKHLSGK